MVYEIDDFISYGGCGVSYYIEGLVSNLEKFSTLTRDVLSINEKILPKMHHKVISVDFNAKTVKIKESKKR